MGATSFSELTKFSSPFENSALQIEQEDFINQNELVVFQPILPTSGWTFSGIIPKHYVWLNGKWNIVR